MKYLFIFNLFVALILYKSAEYKLNVNYFTYYGLFFFLGLLFLNFFLLIFWKFKKLKTIGITFLLIPIFNFFSGFLILSMNINDNLYPVMSKNESKQVFIKNVTGFNLGIDKEFLFSTDHFGFRKNPNKKVNYLKKGENYRIIAFGGSTTLNDHLDDRLTWSNLLEEKFNSTGFNTEVINTGINGLTTKQNYKTFVGMSKYQIDAAIFLIGANDWQLQLRDPKKVDSIFYYLFNIEDTLLYQFVKKIRDNLSFFNNPMSAPGSEFKGNKALLNIPKERSKKKKNFLIKDISADFKYHVKKIINYCNKKKIKCIFLTQPNIFYNELDIKYDVLLKSNYLENKDMVKLINLYNDYLLNQNQKQKNIFVFDLASKIEKNLLYFRDDYHFTKLGSQKVSDELSIFFKENIF
jgi:lysophospholipase L1-like esterase